MKIILQENIEKLGTRGEVVDVATGYARNYLLPRKIALEATAGNLKQLERIRARLAKIEAKEHASAQELATQVAAVTIRLERKAGQNDQLFGSVTAADIAESLEAQGLVVDKRKVALAEPIKLVGEYQVAIKLHHNIAADVKVIVAREGGEAAPAQAPAAANESGAAAPGAEKTPAE